MTPIPRAVARANRYVLNPLMRRVAGRLPGFGIVTHVGRRSGREFTTPINIFRDGEDWRIALTYGVDADWVKNVQAAGRCTVLTRGRRVHLTGPRLVHDPARSWAPPVVREILGLTGVPDSLVLTESAERSSHAA